MRKKAKIIIATLSILAILACVCLAAQKEIKLYIDGNVVSSGVKIIDGTSYVPVKDIAKALNKDIVQKPDGYDLIIPGGTYQIEGVTQGKIGDELFTGKWRFQVLSIEEISKDYKEVYYQEARTITPEGKTDTLILIHCKIKNGLKNAQFPVLTERVPGNTALADENGQSYAPLDYDARQDQDKIQSYSAASLLPGAGMDFTLVFSVPRGTKPKALVFTPMTYSDDIGNPKTVDVRVNLETK